jgi:hypothetical protein
VKKTVSLQECSVQNPAVKRGFYGWYLECVIQWGCYSSRVKIRRQETASGDCNRLRTLVTVCQWFVKCNHESWVYKWSINRITNPNPVYSHPYTWQYNLNIALVNLLSEMLEAQQEFACMSSCLHSPYSEANISRLLASVRPIEVTCYSRSK